MSDPILIATEFNNIFSNIGSKLAQQFSPTNDFKNYLNVKNYFVLYADDTCMFRSDSDISNNISIVNPKLLNVKKWMQANCLTLNFKKCHYLLFRRKQRVLPDNINNIYLGGAKLNKQENTKYLGVVLDEHLSWAVHVNHLCRKLSKFIPLLYNVRENVLKENLRFVYNSLIYPVLIYCNVVCGGGGGVVAKPT